MAFLSCGSSVPLSLCTAEVAEPETYSGPRLPRRFIELPAGATSPGPSAASRDPHLGAIMVYQVVALQCLKTIWLFRRLVLPAVALTLVWVIWARRGVLVAAHALALFLHVSRPSLESLEDCFDMVGGLPLGLSLSLRLLQMGPRAYDKLLYSVPLHTVHFAACIQFLHRVLGGLYCGCAASSASLWVPVR